jgi:hypothetical protein
MLRAFFQLLQFPITHDMGRLVTLVYWVASSLLAAVFVYRLSKSTRRRTGGPEAGDDISGLRKSTNAETAPFFDPGQPPQSAAERRRLQELTQHGYWIDRGPVQFGGWKIKPEDQLK